MKKYWWGSQVPVMRRLTRPATGPIGSSANGTPLVRADVASITFSLHRLKDSEWTIVHDSGDVPQDQISLAIADVMYDAMQGWRQDTIGYNFKHVISQQLLAPIAVYRALYRVTTTDGVKLVFARVFQVDYTFDAGVQPGSSTVFVAGDDGDDGDDGAGYLATSTTSVSIGTGSKSFTTQSGLAYTAGARVRTSSAADTSNYMEGLVTAYSGTTLVVNMTRESGSGTFADWNINLAGDVGATGATGATGSTGGAGATGATGPGYRATSASSVASGTGIKTFITQTGLAYSSGARVRVTNTADLDSFMEGVVFTYTSNILVIDVDLVTSSGTISSWNINVAGERGQTGLQGEQGVQGEPGIQGEQGVPGAPGSGGGSGYIFDVTSDTYGAVGDGTTDDTAAIQAAFDAADAYSAGKAVVYFPELTYIVGTATLAGSGAIDLAGDGIKIAGAGVIKLAPASAADCALLISGDYNQIDGVVVDGNAAGSPAGRGESIRISGSYNQVTGVVGQNNKTTGGAGSSFMIFGADPIHNVLTNCVSRNAGQAGFDDRGDYTTIRDCQAIDFGVYGYTKGGGATEQVTIDGFYFQSSSAAANSGVIIDPGAVDNYIVRHATVRNVRGQLVPNAVVYVKFARIHYLEIDSMHLLQGVSETVSTIKIVEAVKSVSIKNSYFSRAIDFDEGAGVTGAFGPVADNGSGYCRFTDTAHGLLAGDIIYIPDSSVSGYNGLQEVTATPDADTFDTDFRWTATATGNWYGCTGQVVLENVAVGSLEDSAAWRISGMRTPRFTAKNCRLIGCLTKAFAPKNSYPFTAVERYDIENCDMVFNRSSSDAYVLTGETNSTEYFTSSRKLRWVNNSYRNVLAGTVQSLYSTDARILATSLDGGRDYILASGSFPSGTDVTWQVGDRFWKPSPAAGASPGWVCTTAGTFTAGTFSPMQALSAVAQDYRFIATANGTAVASTTGEVSATPATGTGSLQFGGSRALAVGEAAEVTASGSYSTTATPTLNFGVSVGKSQGAGGSPAAETGRVKLAEGTAFTTGSSVSNLRWRLELLSVVKVVATSGTIQVSGRIAYETAADTWVEKWIEPVDVTVNTAITSHNRKLDVWADWGTSSASNTFTCKQFSVTPR